MTSQPTLLGLASVAKVCSMDSKGGALNRVELELVQLWEPDDLVARQANFRFPVQMILA